MDTDAFFRGLGLDPTPLTEAEAQDVGRLVRILVLGLMDLHSSLPGIDDSAQTHQAETNPLKGEWPPATKLRYIFGGRLAAAGLPPPERALRELLAELVTDQTATRNAALAAIEVVLREFAPGAVHAAEKSFADAYLRESLRIRRDTPRR
jgi:predicted component of type VI protein secretion system